MSEAVVCKVCGGYGETIGWVGDFETGYEAAQPCRHCKGGGIHDPERLDLDDRTVRNSALAMEKAVDALEKHLAPSLEEIQKQAMKKIGL